MRSPARLAVACLMLAVASLVAACGTTSTASPAPSARPVPATDAPTPVPTVPAESGAAEPSAVTSEAPTTTQSETEWGRIWDAVPAGFPRYPGATTTEDMGPEPVSDAYAVADGDPAEIAAWMQTALETATYSTEALSGPLEDGSFVLDSVGDGDCRMQVTIAPTGGLTVVTVRYGTDCPFD
jgi:hypothetical protein